jgi:hypothetical protein
MARCDVLHFKRVVQGCDDFLDVRIIGYYEVKPTGKDADARVDGGRRGNDLVDTGCEQPTTITMPSGVLMASDSSRSSNVPGLSETSESRWMSGAISVSLSMS